MKITNAIINNCLQGRAPDNIGIFGNRLQIWIYNNYFQDDTQQFYS